METIDLSNDPYILRNHLGSFECKLCLTLHTTEGNYLAHTQGRRHQVNIGRRAKQEELAVAAKARMAAPARVVTKKARTIKIGRPGYKVTKLQDPDTNQRSVVFEIQYPEIRQGLQPRHRIMSAFEQTKEKPDRNFQYVLFAAEPYETVAFKVPSLELDRTEGKFHTSWDKETRIFTMQMYFLDKRKKQIKPMRY